MPGHSDVFKAIAKAEKLLPGRAAPEGKIDPRWQAIIAVSEFIDSNPEDVWEFIVRWGKNRNSDLRAAVATCLLEHLLDRHFATYFPRLEVLARKSPLFAKTFSMCWKFGQAEEPKNANRWDRLEKSLQRKR